MLQLASYAATRGTAPRTPAKGFLIVVGDRHELMSGKLGTFGKLNKYESNEISVIGILDRPDDLAFVLPDFGMDKAMIVCGETGRILANKVRFVTFETLCVCVRARARESA